MSRVAARSAMAIASAFALLASPTIAQNQSNQTGAEKTAAQEFKVLFETGSYRASLIPGAKALSLSPDDNELRLQLANALAWTGRYDAAIAQYERLLPDQNFEARARVGLAGILRWRGASQVALPILQEAEKKEPQNKDVQTALMQTQRELRAMTSAKLSQASDSNQLTRIELSANQRFWPQTTVFGKPLKLELGAATGADTLGALKLRHKELSFSIALTPMGQGPRAATDWGNSAGARLELSAQHDLKTRIFGRVHADFLGDAFSLRAGHVNWGRQVFSAAALQAGLTANQFGLSGNFNSEWLLVKARLDSYSISDGNRVLDSDVAFNPTWQPLPFGIQWYNSYAFRRSDRVDPKYWSPKNNLTSTIGLKRSWYFDNGEFSVSAGKSLGITRESRGGYTFAANGKYWIARDTSLGLDLFAIDAPRIGAYRYHYLGVSMNQLW
jgi:tetratricopeptide (TPR) repeat protein